LSSGLLIDVHQGALLGQHALAYTLLSFAATSMHRRLLWFGVVEQALQILPLFFGAPPGVAGRGPAGGRHVPGLVAAAGAAAQALLWPVAMLVLLAPQRRAPDPDQNRPL
jgi:rod shape-determining protein MreD